MYHLVQQGSNVSPTIKRESPVVSIDSGSNATGAMKGVSLDFSDLFVDTKSSAFRPKSLTPKVKKRRPVDKQVKEDPIPELTDSQKKSPYLQWMSLTINQYNDWQVGKSLPNDGMNDGFHKLHQLRQRALIHRKWEGLWASDTMQKIRSTVREEIGKGKLQIREDRDLYADLTMRKEILSILLSYSTEWLQLGLEIMFQEKIRTSEEKGGESARALSDGVQLPQQSYSGMKATLRKFIINRLLTDDKIVRKYGGRCRVPSHKFQDKFKEETRAVVLYRILMLFSFLDRAADEKLLPSRLFCKDSVFKSTRSVIQSFSREFLAREGDVTKHLQKIGIKVYYEGAREFDVGSVDEAGLLAVGDGINMARLAEVVTGSSFGSMLKHLKFPAVKFPAMSHLQNLQNVKLVLQVFQEDGVDFPSSVTASNIVEGKSGTVADLVVSLFLRYAFIPDEDRICKEICTITGLSVQDLRKQIQLSHKQTKKERVQALLVAWCGSISSLHYGVDFEEISQFDGVLACCLIHFHAPQVMNLDLVLPTSRNTNFMETFEGSYKDLFLSQRQNCALANDALSSLGTIGRLVPVCDATSSIEEDAVFLFLASVFLHLREYEKQGRAASVIQGLYLTKREEKRESERRAASWIQTGWRDHLARRKAREVLLTLKRNNEREVAYSRILDAWVSFQQVKECKSKLNFLKEQKQAALQHDSANVIRRAWLNWKRIQTIISFNTARLQAQQEMTLHLIAQDNAATTIQRAFLAWKVFKAEQDMLCATLIQSCWRGFWAQVKFHVDRFDVIAVQSCGRRFLARLDLRRSLAAATRIQAAVRMFQARAIVAERVRNRHEKCAVRIQNAVRLHQSRKGMSSNIFAAITIQKAWRGFFARSHWMPCFYEDYEVVADSNKALDSIVAANKIRNAWIDYLATRSKDSHRTNRKRMFQEPVDTQNDSLTSQDYARSSKTREANLHQHSSKSDAVSNTSQSRDPQASVFKDIVDCARASICRRSLVHSARASLVSKLLPGLEDLVVESSNTTVTTAPEESPMSIPRMILVEGSQAALDHEDLLDVSSASAIGSRRRRRVSFDEASLRQNTRRKMNEEIVGTSKTMLRQRSTSDSFETEIDRFNFNYEAFTELDQSWKGMKESECEPYSSHDLDNLWQDLQGEWRSLRTAQ